MSNGKGIEVDRFRHEALLYAGMTEFLSGTVPFIRDAVKQEEPILVVVSEKKIRLLREALGPLPKHVEFGDMSAVGANPARIIPRWQTFVDEHRVSGRPFRGIGEPIYPERTSTELVECVRHEALLNVAFEGSGAWWLLCPYDTTALPPSVIEQAHRTHPFVAQDRVHDPSKIYSGVVEAGAPFRTPLPEPRAVLASATFDRSGLAQVRRIVSNEAAHAAFDSESITRLVAAANEVATNSVIHGGGSGLLRLWRDGDLMTCEIRDAGQLSDPLVDRRRPQRDAHGGRGLWLANQLCDLVQIRSFPAGTTVRLHLRRDRNR